MSTLRLLGMIFPGLFLMLSAFSACATCSFYRGTAPMIWDNINIGTVYAQRDTPVGSIIYSTVLPATFSGEWLTCGSGELISATMFRDAVSGFSHIYDTGIPGVGIKAYYQTSGTFDNPPRTGINSSSGGTVSALGLGSGIKIELYKTGPISSGNIEPGLYFQKTYGELEVVRGSIVGGQVIQVACSLRNQNINVALPDVLGIDFTGPGATPGETSFTVDLDCDAGARINVSLSGSKSAETSDTSILALSGAGTAGVARGVGIQLLYGNTPLKINNNIVLKTSTGGQEFPADAFTARYFQTRDKVTAGSANSTATLNITYQ
ncbi:fimbrial protein [Buttiauxella noackiae]|uniref:fimbrial protein n=1 Tax=Buttiauxella noackiae TaxID=82992 RepID=UPI00068F3DB6|nr:fimbrial protein [Buttiauxella noackiae]